MPYRAPATTERRSRGDAEGEGVIGIDTRGQRDTPAPPPAKPGRARRSIEKFSRAYAFHVLPLTREPPSECICAVHVCGIYSATNATENRNVFHLVGRSAFFLPPRNYSLQIRIIVRDLNLKLYSYKKPRQRKRQKDELPSARYEEKCKLISFSTDDEILLCCLKFITRIKFFIEKC